MPAGIFLECGQMDIILMACLGGDLIFQIATRITMLDAFAGKPKTGSNLEMLYDIPENAWYFAENRDAVMPFCVLMEIALQPCGWLAAVNLDASVRPVPHLLFRNLDGKGTVHRAITRKDSTIRTTTRLTSYSRIGESIIVKFDVHCFAGTEEVFTLDAVFGFFPESAFRDQKGLDVEAGELTALHAPVNFELNLRAHTEEYFGKSAKMQLSKLLMVDRITGCWPEGGKAGKGRWRGEKRVDPGDWYFKAHFYTDPVQPGSLGVEGIMQMIQLHMLYKKMDQGLNHPRFEPCLPDRLTEWHFRGQVVPHNDHILFEMEILKEENTETGFYVEAEGWLWVNEKKIYHIPKIGMRLLGEKTLSDQTLFKKALQVKCPRYDRYELRITREKRHLEQFIDLYRQIFVHKCREPYYPVPKLPDLNQGILVVSLEKDQVTGGGRVFSPGNEPFVGYKFFEPSHLLPDWRELRRFGAIGEATSLISRPNLRGKANFSPIWDYTKDILKALGGDDVLVNGFIKTKTYLLYSAIGFKPIAPPLCNNYPDEFSYPNNSLTPKSFPMIARLYPHLPMPSCALDIDFTQIEAFVRQAMENSVPEKPA